MNNKSSAAMAVAAALLALMVSMTIFVREAKGPTFPSDAPEAHN